MQNQEITDHIKHPESVGLAPTTAPENRNVWKEKFVIGGEEKIEGLVAILGKETESYVVDSRKKSSPMKWYTENH